MGICRNKIFLAVLFLAVFAEMMPAGCAGADTKRRKENFTPETEKRLDGTKPADLQVRSDGTEAVEEEIQSDSTEPTELQEHPDSRKQRLHFVDVFGQEYVTDINPDVTKHDYDLKAFLHQGDSLVYQGDMRYTSRLGVDVSHHQGAVDWERVRKAGYEFAFLRIGYRGYGKEGRVCLDREFFSNIKGAQAAGMDVGVYFFSQAINETEAAEEAEFVLKNLEGYSLQLPVVYDPESILDAEARTDDVPGAQFTKNTQVFCRMIAEAGYKPMIYSNMLWEAYEFDLAQLSEYPVWYADYEKLPQTPYHFAFWQYSNEGTVDGIAGAVDLDIQLIPAEDTD